MGLPKSFLLSARYLRDAGFLVILTIISGITAEFGHLLEKKQKMQRNIVSIAKLKKNTYILFRGLNPLQRAYNSTFYPETFLRILKIA